MKCVNTILKISAALIAVAGAAFVVYKFWDKIVEKVSCLKGKCPCCKTAAQETEAPAEETPVEEAPAEETAPVEAPAEETTEPAPAAEPEVTEADFAD